MLFAVMSLLSPDEITKTTLLYSERRRLRLATLVPLLLALGGCGGSDDGGTALPRPSAATPATLLGSCEALADALHDIENTTITASSTVAEGTLTVGRTPVAEHCQVTGKMHERVSSIDGQTYAIGFEMRLPKNWNGRFFHQGNGGIDGDVITATGSFGGGPETHALQQGFAVLSSDAGHTKAQGIAFGIDPQARQDYGYQAVGKLTPMAKRVIEIAYGKVPDRSYFGGCSNGGRHAMVAASRYADEYDGLVAGAPGYNLPKAAIASIFGAQRYASIATDPADLSTAFTAAERALVVDAVLAKCDALDGATDGLVQDTDACQASFSLANDVPTCGGARDGTCLSAEQKAVIASIFSGATTNTGSAVYSSFPYDSGLVGKDIAFWEFVGPLVLDSGAVGVIFKVPPESPGSFNGPEFTLSSDIGSLLAQVNATDATYTESAMSFMTPPDPTELGTLKNRGAKLLVYHGVSDAIFSVDDTTAWYEGLRQNNGGDASSFARFFRVPGMNHCAGGPSTDQFDLLTPLVEWVETGKAPDRILATARGAGNPGGVNDELPTDWSANRTRPLCPYPKVARYDGSGDVESADSFVCE
jgi:pimeloyl-ACP methyl ester carboxylesterase